MVNHGSWWTLTHIQSQIYRGWQKENNKTEKRMKKITKTAHHTKERHENIMMNAIQEEFIIKENRLYIFIFSLSLPFYSIPFSFWNCYWCCLFFCWIVRLLVCLLFFLLATPLLSFRETKENEPTSTSINSVIIIESQGSFRFVRISLYCYMYEMRMDEKLL